MFEELCRMCANKIRDQENAKNIFAGRAKYRKQIEIFVGKEFPIIEGMPNRICERCQSELDLAMKFRERFLFSQKYLFEIVTKSQKCVDEDAIMFVNAFDELYKNTIEYEKQKKTYKSSKRRPRQTKKTHNLKARENELENEFHVQEDMPTVESEMEELFDMEEEIKIEVAHEAVQEEAAKMLESPFTAEESEAGVPKQCNQFAGVKRKRISNYFVCEQCGHYFNDQSNFRAHLQRHTNKKRYQCDHCQQRFHVKSELVRHMSVHSGSRPHKCEYCDKCFADRGSKLRHERAHANERPYPCLECEKAFVTANELKIHLVVHSEQRSYVCKVCNAGFRRQTHLDAHYRSQAHLKNAEQMFGAQLQNLDSDYYDDEDPLVLET